MTDEMVRITAKEYDDLKYASALLECLQMAGVDNWSGYSYAFELLKEYYPEYYDKLFE